MSSSYASVSRGNTAELMERLGDAARIRALAYRDEWSREERACAGKWCNWWKQKLEQTGLQVVDIVVSDDEIPDRGWAIDRWRRWDREFQCECLRRRKADLRDMLWMRDSPFDGHRREYATEKRYVERCRRLLFPARPRLTIVRPTAPLHQQQAGRTAVHGASQRGSARSGDSGDDSDGEPAPPASLTLWRTAEFGLVTPNLLRILCGQRKEARR